MRNMIPFQYESEEIRVIQDEKSDPWWVASDVCNVLGLSNSREAISVLDDDEKSTVRISDGGPERNIINEAGLYSLIIRSNKPEAKKFKRWITHEVIPQIRKQGFYTLPGSHQYALNFINTEANAAIRMAKIFGFKGNQALLSANRAVKQRYDIDCLELMGAVHLISDDNEIHLTPTEVGKELGSVSARKVNKILEEMGLQQPFRDAKGKLRQWEPTADGLHYTVLKDTGKQHSDGTPVQQLFWKKSVLRILDT